MRGGPDKPYTHSNGYVQNHPTWEVLCTCGKSYNLIGWRLKGRNARKHCPRCAQRTRQLNGRISHHYLRRLQGSAQKRGIAFDPGLTKEVLSELLFTQNHQCALSGFSIGFADTVYGEKHGESTASLDRIDSTRGYIVGNVQWVHKDVNRMKSSFDQARFIEMAHAISAHQQQSST